MVVMLGEGGVTVERLDMMAEGETGDKWRVMSDNCKWSKSLGLPGVVLKSGRLNTYLAVVMLQYLVCTSLPAGFGT